MTVDKIERRKHIVLVKVHFFIAGLLAAAGGNGGQVLRGQVLPVFAQYICAKAAGAAVLLQRVVQVFTVESISAGVASWLRLSTTMPALAVSDASR